jgi:hypothetical protein
MNGQEEPKDPASVGRHGNGRLMGQGSGTVLARSDPPPEPEPQDPPEELAS